MVIRKTGGLFMIATGLMELFSESSKDLSKIVALLAVYFQIRDDFLNLTSKEYADNKSFCDDLTEGKFSFPIIHAINSRRNDREIINILRQHTKDVDVKKYCVRLLDEAGSFEYTRGVLQKLNDEIKAEVNSLGPNKYILNLMDELSI